MLVTAVGVGAGALGFGWGKCGSYGSGLKGMAASAKRSFTHMVKRNRRMPLTTVIPPPLVRADYIDKRNGYYVTHDDNGPIYRKIKSCTVIDGTETYVIDYDAPVIEQMKEAIINSSPFVPSVQRDRSQVSFYVVSERAVTHVGEGFAVKVCGQVVVVTARHVLDRSNAVGQMIGNQICTTPLDKAFIRMSGFDLPADKEKNPEWEALRDTVVMTPVNSFCSKFRVKVIQSDRAMAGACEVASYVDGVVKGSKGSFFRPMMETEEGVKHKSLFEIYHTCSTIGGFSGSPIVRAGKAVGMHLSKTSDERYNCGVTMAVVERLILMLYVNDKREARAVQPNMVSSDKYSEQYSVDEEIEDYVIDFMAFGITQWDAQGGDDYRGRRTRRHHEEEATAIDDASSQVFKVGLGLKQATHDIALTGKPKSQYEISKLPESRVLQSVALISGNEEKAEPEIIRNSADGPVYVAHSLLNRRTGTRPAGKSPDEQSIKVVKEVLQQHGFDTTDKFYPPPKGDATNIKKTMAAEYALVSTPTLLPTEEAFELADQLAKPPNLASTDYMATADLIRKRVVQLTNSWDNGSSTGSTAYQFGPATKGQVKSDPELFNTIVDLTVARILLLIIADTRDLREMSSIERCKRGYCDPVVAFFKGELASQKKHDANRHRLILAYSCVDDLTARFFLGQVNSDTTDSYPADNGMLCGMGLDDVGLAELADQLMRVQRSAPEGGFTIYADFRAQDKCVPDDVMRRDAQRRCRLFTGSYAGPMCNGLVNYIEVVLRQPVLAGRVILDQVGPCGLKSGWYGTSTFDSYATLSSSVEANRYACAKAGGEFTDLWREMRAKTQGDDNTNSSHEVLEKHQRISYTLQGYYIKEWGRNATNEFKVCSHHIKYRDDKWIGIFCNVEKSIVKNLCVGQAQPEAIAGLACAMRHTPDGLLAFKQCVVRICGEDLWRAAQQLGDSATALCF